MMRRTFNFCRRKKKVLCCLGITMVTIIVVVMETVPTDINIPRRLFSLTKHQQVSPSRTQDKSTFAAQGAVWEVIPVSNNHHGNQSNQNSGFLKSLHQTSATSSFPYTMITSNSPLFKQRGITQNKNIQRITADCLPKFDPSGIPTPFKFYIYELPTYFNFDIQKKMNVFSHCYNLAYCGTGEELYQLSNSNQGRALQEGYKLSIRNSHQFSLEVIMHYKLLHSAYRTLDPEKAQLFYIPAYTGLKCLSDTEGASTFIDKLFDYLNTNETSYYRSGKPHFSTLSKIQREQSSERCSTLCHPDSANITYIAIEKESNPSWTTRTHVKGKSIIVAPYPAYVHFINTRHDKRLSEYSNYDIGSQDLLETQFRLDMPDMSERKVFLFLAAGTRRSNPFRAQIIDQFANQTRKSYDTFFANATLNTLKADTSLNQIMLITYECNPEHRTTTIPWMMRSVYCLQPHGDSPTRKSFYDSILSGCIPVLFSEKFKTEYPFASRLHYDDFTVTIDEKLISKYNTKIIDVLSEISVKKRQYLQENVLKVAKWFQYSVPDGDVQTDDDAITLILDQLQTLYNL